MPACQLTETQRRGRLELTLSGTLDGPSAWELVSRLKAEPRDVLVDFGHVEKCSDFGLMVLAHALVERARPALLMGLNHHQLRMLRYLGVSVSDAGVVVPEGTLQPTG